MTTQTIVKCAHCNGLNAHGLPFCMFCGSSLVGTDDVKLISPRPCNACSVVDPLSQKYCVSCGATMNPSREHTVLVQQKPALPATSPRLNQQERKRRTQHRTRQAIFSATAAAALAGLAVGGAYLYSQNQIAQNTGLLVYASPSGADVFVEDSHNCLVKSGKIKSNGELLIKGMAAGRYSLTVSKLGYKPNEQAVVLVPNKIASIGIPERIDLLSLERVPSPASVIAGSTSAAVPISKNGNSAASTIKSSQPARSEVSSVKIAQSSGPLRKKPLPEPKARSAQYNAKPQKTITELDHTNSETASTTLHGEQDVATSKDATSTQLAPPSEEPIIPNKFMRRRMQNPHMDRRFAQGLNGPFCAVGYPVILPSNPPFFETNAQRLFNDPDSLAQSKRFRPNMRQVKKMIQNQPLRPTVENQ